MKKIFALPLVIALSILSSCQKQETEAERKAEVDREVQQRIDAEHQAQEREQLAQREGELSAREKALAEKENAPAKTRKPESRSTTRTEERTTRAEERRPTGSYDTFYTKLDRYGDWRESSDYGYVFQPREAQQSRSWRPYTDGRWVYTDVGWTWISEEPFGWATYHYGRWTRLRNIGWVWVPGDEWAPAWVSWRKSDEYVGWAPLPPEARFDRRTGIHNWSDNYYDIGPDQYSFVETRQFGAPRAQRAVVPVARNVTIVNQTTNVTDITYNNTTVINQGPNYDELRTRTQQPIERLRLERQVNVDVNVAAPQQVVRGEMVVIPAPLIARGQAVERPRTVKETIANVVVERGWEAITDRQAADKARAKMKSEATPPPDAPSKTFVKPAQARAETTAATPASSPSIAPTQAESPSPTLTATPSATARATARPELSPSATAIATATATATPALRSTASPSATPLEGETSTPRSTFAPRPPARSTSTPATSASASPSATASASSTGEQSASPSFERPRAGEKLRSMRKLNEERGTQIQEGLPAAGAELSPGASASPDLGARRRMIKSAASVLPSPSASPATSPTKDVTADQAQPRKRMESQAQTAEPRRTVPMNSPAAATPSRASTPNASIPPSEDRESKKEEKTKRKQEREKAAAAEASPSTTPTPAEQ